MRKIAALVGARARRVAGERALDMRAATPDADVPGRSAVAEDAETVDLGQVAGLAVDARDHVWIIQRPWSLANDEKAPNADAPCCHPAPPVMEFDAAGNYIQGWGGEGAGYEWPADEHTIHVDSKATSGSRPPADRGCRRGRRIRS